MSYATTETGHRNVGKSGNVRIIRTEAIGSTLVNVIQTTITENEQYLGLDEATAKNLASVATQGGQGLVLTSLGGIKITVGFIWFSVYGCRGTIQTARASRMGDSSLWQVDFQRQTLSCTADGGTIEEI